MLITWYGHSCFKIESTEGSIIFDPYAPGKVPGLSLPPITADAVVCSHGHDDHNYACGVTLTGKKPSFTLRQIRTYHDGKKGALRGENLITAVDMEGMRVVHMGDIGHLLTPEQVKELGRVDVLFIPVGGYYTIDAQTAAMTVSAIAPRIVIPMHYRGDSFGFDVLSKADDFARLSGNVKRFDSSAIEIDAATPPMTALLKCPV